MGHPLSRDFVMFRTLAPAMFANSIIFVQYDFYKLELIIIKETHPLNKCFEKSLLQTRNDEIFRLFNY